MAWLFEIPVKCGRAVHLSKDRWAHIQNDHGDVELVTIEQTLTTPTKIVQSDSDPTVQWYLRYMKNKRRDLMVSVKYLNGRGYVITAYHTTKIP